MRKILAICGRLTWVAVRILLVVALIVGFAILRPPAFLLHHIEEQLALQISAETPPHVSIGRLRIDLANLSMAIEDLHIGASATTQPSVRIRRIQADLALSWTGGPRLHPRRLFVEQPVIQWSPEVAFAIAQLSLGGGDGGPVPAIHLVDGQVEGTFPEVGWVHLSQIQLEAVPDDHQKLQLRGHFEAPSSGGFRFEGAVDTDAGTYRLDLAADELWPDPSDLPHLSSDATRFAREYELEGRVDLRLRAGGDFSSIPRVHGMARFRDLRFRVADIGIAVDHCHGYLLLDEAGHGHIGAQGEACDNPFQITAFATELTSLDPDVTAAIYTPRPARFAPWVRKLFLAIDGPWEQFDAFELAGETSLSVVIQRMRGSGDLRAFCEIDITSASGSFVGFAGDDIAFPYPLRDLGGRISFRQTGLLIAGLRGRSPTGGARIEGAVWEGDDLGIDLSIVLEAARADAELDHAVRGLPRAREVWEQFQIDGGLFDMDFRLSKAMEEDEVTTSGEIQLSEGRGRYLGFPYPITSLQGTILVESHGSRFDVSGIPEGANHPGRLRITGIVGHQVPGSTGQSGVALHIQAQDLAPSAALLAAVEASDAEDAVNLRELLYQGNFDLDHRLSRPANASGEEFESHLMLKPLGGRLRHREAPFAMSASAGRMHRVQEHYTKRETARVAQPRFHAWILGAALDHWQAPRSPTPGDGPQAVSLLEVRGYDHPRGMRLAWDLQALQHSASDVAAILGETLENQVLEEARIGRGEIDIELTATRAPMLPTEFSGRFDLYAVHLDLPGLPTPIEELSGSVELDDQHRMTTSRLTARVANATGDRRANVTLEDVRFNHARKSATIDARAQLVDLTLDENLSFFLGDTVAQELMRMKLSGIADLSIDSIHLDFPIESDEQGAAKHLGRPTVSFGGSAEIRESTMDPGFKIEDFAGRIKNFRGDVDRNGQSSIKAWVEGGRLRIFGLPLAGIQARIGLEGSTLTVENLSGQLFKGPVQGGGRSSERNEFLSLTMGSEDAFDLKLDIKGTRLEDVLKAVLGSDVSTTGEMEANLSIFGPTRDMRGMRGYGNVAVREGNLGSIPIISSLNPFLSSDASVFRSASVRFTIEGFIVTVEELALESDAVELIGSGVIGLDGSLLLSIDITYLEILPIPLLSGIIARGLGILLAANPIVHLEVQGTLDDPRVVAKLGPGGGAQRLDLRPRPYVPPRLAPRLGIRR